MMKKQNILQNITNFTEKFLEYSINQKTKLSTVFFNSDYHDKRRKIEYYKIKRMLGQEESNNNSSNDTDMAIRSSQSSNDINLN